jgi:hypothetical protein
MTNIKDQILVLFQDNVMGGISAEDMRIFVNAVFDSKENEIRVYEKLQDVTDYRLSNPMYPINQNDVVIITDHNNTAEYTDSGIYLAPKTNPSGDDLVRLSNVNYDEFLQTGDNGQLITVNDGVLTWIDPIEGYYIEGTAEIMEILLKKPDQKGPVWIAENTDLTAPVPGEKGDGYSWNGYEWKNVGQLRGPEGDVINVAMASQYETDGGFIDYKAISPKTLNDYRKWRTKEDFLSLPSNDDDMLISRTDGTRYWQTPVRRMEDLYDVSLIGIVPNSIIVYDGVSWKDIDLDDIISKQFITLQDTPASYTHQALKGVMVNGSENGLVFTDLVTGSTDLADFDARTPIDGQILKFTNNKWTPTNDSRSGVSASRPINPIIGTPFFDVTLGIPIWFNGAT